MGTPGPASAALPFPKNAQLEKDTHNVNTECVKRPLTLDDLVVYLTSAHIMDYAATSDFFLTFRMFSSAPKVLELLLVRLALALDRVASASTVSDPSHSESGRDTALRTFVVLRHWILNFFADDFLPDIQLRQTMAASINKLCAVPVVGETPFLLHLFGQLKRCWISQLAVYWDLGQDFVVNALADLGQDIYAGGPFGSAHSSETDLEKRRFMVFRLYKGPISPIPDSIEQAGELGTLIKGRLQLDPNVEVPFIQDFQSNVDEAPRVSRRTRLLRKLRFEQKPGKTQRLRLKPSTGDGLKVDLHGKVDLLARRALEHFTAMVDAKEQFANTPVAKQLGTGPEFDESDFSIGGTPSMIDLAAPIADTANLPQSDSESDSEYVDSTDFLVTTALEGEETRDNLPPLRTATSYLFDDMPPPISSKDSLATLRAEGASDHEASQHWSDTLDLGSQMSMGINMTSSDNYDAAARVFGDDDLMFSMDTPADGLSITSTTSPNWRSSHASYASSMYSSKVNLRQSAIAGFPNLRQSVLGDLGIEQASYHGSMSSLSTLSRRSFISAHSERLSADCLGGCDYSDTSRQPQLMPSRPLPRTPHGLAIDHREQEIYCEDDCDAVSEISLLSELSESAYEMIPCAGYTSRDAEKLAAIPDDSLSSDPLTVALQKLEGTYVPGASMRNAQQLRGRSGGEFSLGEATANLSRINSIASADVQLYSAAFASKTDLRAILDRASVSSLAIPTNDGPNESTPRASMYNGAVGETQGAVDAELPKSASSGTVLNLALEHAPFILSAAPLAVAEQFTIIEREAVQQIDWRDLVEMKWSHMQGPVDSWLWFLAEGAAHGVDVVTTRFNLVVNWVKSEILLCKQASLKAQAISRFIQIACACLEMQNFASLLQIVLALTSDAIANRQVAAWSLLSKVDCERLDSLEQLITPLRNFSKLRKAHKRIDFSVGCIPFTGLYLADLTANHEKPSTDAGKVSFPKFQSIASIVRSYVQCVEWSKNYNLVPDPALLSKCLYLQSLSSFEMEQLAGATL